MPSRCWIVTALVAAAVLVLPGAAQVQNFRPVNVAALNSPADGDWPLWRRTTNAWGYSPLDQINVRNASKLTLAWSWSMHDGSQQTEPLVHDGVMYIANPGFIVQALDGATGALLWESKPPGAGGAGGSGRIGGSSAAQGQLRNIAIYDDKIFITTSDARVAALNARNGQIVWNTQVADPALRYEFTSGPIIADGKVVAGLTGCSQYKDESCYIIALDPNTGKEVWRMSTVARPGEPGGDTWGDLPLMFRAGVDAWMPGNYDPETRTLYWGTSQAKPWVQSVRGTTGDALYSNSTLALDPATGKLKWYYQHIPGESHDLDEAFERILINYDGKSSLFTMGKIGILWEIDRYTGKFRSAHDLGYQNVIDVDPTTGHVTFRPGMLPEIGKPVYVCPSTSGFKDWRAMSYLPATQALYVSLELTCSNSTFNAVERVPGGGGYGPFRRELSFHPKSPADLGEFVALDIRTGAVKWSHRARTPFNTSALTTAGGVVVTGDWDRNLFVYDAKNGDVLFQTRTANSPQGGPISYAVRGKQYIAVPIGGGGGSWSTTVPFQLTPERQRPTTGTGVVVLALPGK